MKATVSLFKANKDEPGVETFAFEDCTDIGITNTGFLKVIDGDIEYNYPIQLVYYFTKEKNRIQSIEKS